MLGIFCLKKCTKQIYSGLEIKAYVPTQFCGGVLHGSLPLHFFTLVFPTGAKLLFIEIIIDLFFCFFISFEHENITDNK